MKKKLLYALIAVVILGSLTACGKESGGPAPESSGGTKKLTFVLDWTPNTNHTGIYAAQEKGYLKEAGIELEIVQPPEDGAEILVASEKAQFGVSFQDSMAPALTGENALPIEAVAAILQHNTSGILSRRGEGLERPRGLEGKKYATWDLDLEKATIRNVMEADGGDFGKVKLIPSTVTDEASALKSKSVDAIWVFYGWGGMAAREAGLETDFFAFKDSNAALDFYTPVIIGNRNWMEKNPEITRAFLSAVRRGYEFCIENPEEAAEILLKAAPELDSGLVKASQNYMKDQYRAEAPKWGLIDPARWNAFYNWVNQNGLSETKIPENTGFTNEYWE